MDPLLKIFEQEKMPDEWRDSVIVPIFKGKGTSRIVGITYRHQYAISYHSGLGKNN